MLPLVQTIDTSEFTPFSPDPAGIDYLPLSNTLLISDSEVNESPYFGTVNMFEISLSGSLINTFSILDFSREPTGVAYNPANQHLFISNDDANQIVELNPGADLIYGTADDSTTVINTTSFGSFDAEGVAYASDLGTLFVADGSNSAVYQISTSGILISSFDTASLGVTDPEGIEYDPSSGNLFIVGDPVNLVAEVTTSGTLVNTLDISAANPIKPAGLALAPNSQNPAELSLYVTDRGIDNNKNPNISNDGKVYEFSLGEAPPPINLAPIVSAGADQVITDTSVFLDATVNDDGLPNPPGALTYNWSQVSGPGTVVFSDPNAEDTAVTFPGIGEYVFSLEASDGELSNSDQVTVTVVEPPEFSTLYASFRSSGTVGGVSFRNEDILAFDFASQTWSLYFDGSNVGLGSGSTRINALHVDSDGSILFSLNQTTTLPDVGSVDDTDIIRFVPSSTGSNNTSGTFEWYFNGSDVGLTTSGEDIDAIAFTTDDRLVISTKGSVNVTGVSGADEDLLVFNATSLGQNTSGTWELYADNSDVGLTSSSEDLNAAWINNNGDIYLSTEGNFTVSGLDGEGSDIFIFSPSSLGDDTSGTFSPFWDGSQNGLIEGISLI
ncbi:MAG: SdiA-regulated domain-containing protein [Pleurocapsa sp.]